MTIHHATRTRAEKAGILLEEVDGGVTATNHQYGIKVGPVAKAQDALMSCIMRIEQRQKGEYESSSEPPAEPNVDETIEEQQVVEDAKPIERIGAVPIDGAIAYAEGISAADCPYFSETDDDEEYANFERWNEEWDAAADAHEAEEEGGSKGGSVVSEKYRARYAEMGHPTHCGDWLAELLNNLCLTKKDTDLDRFEAICAANGVDTSKYKRDGVGWQGRIRMTGRNLLAKRVYLAGGVIKTPVEGAEAEYRAPAEWMATQRFKMPKADQAKPVPVAEPVEQPAPEADELEGPEPQF